METIYPLMFLAVTAKILPFSHCIEMLFTQRMKREARDLVDSSDVMRYSEGRARRNNTQ